MSGHQIICFIHSLCGPVLAELESPGGRRQVLDPLRLFRPSVQDQIPKEFRGYA